MKEIPPSQGERGALSGYIPQYQIAADLIYTALLKGTLEWINVADPEAGRVDDIQFGTTGRLDACQVKWGMSIGTLSFTDMTSPIGNKPSIMAQLADGWIRLKKVNPERHVIVHFITPDIASSSRKAKIPTDDPKPSQPTFQGFYNDCWKNRSWAKIGFSAIPQGWSLAVSEIQEVTGLDEREFLEFVQSCELHFSYPLPSNESNFGQEDPLRVKYITQLAKLLIDIVGVEHQVIKLSAKELLKRLGWEDQFSQRFLHEFPINELLYQPIKATVGEIETSISQFQQGYLALVGTPGSGKSTTLTHTLRNRPGFRVVRYYAYVPKPFVQGRGEAFNFLHDLYITLKNSGITGIEGSHPTSREDLQKRFGEQLGELGLKWREERIQTIILVDGLDHIERELSPARSLIEDLPHPDTIPEGVLFILGTQTLELKGLSDVIKSQLRETGRKIIIQQLDRDAIYRIIDSYNLPISLTAEQKESVHRLSRGHPLALIYLLNRLLTTDTPETVQEILNETDPYSGHIDTVYQIYWEKLQGIPAVKNLLALVARVRIPFDPRELVKWVDENTVKVLLEGAGHYFQEETRYRWRFFHNSFRQFIITKTKLDIFGYLDPQLERDYHEKLANYSALASPGSPWSWEELYHRANAGDFDSVIKLGTQKRFRDQFISFRPFTAIKDDIGLVLNSAQHIQYPLAIIRCILIEYELNERHHLLEQTDLIDLILELKGPSTVTDYILEERSLLIDPAKSLKICLTLLQRSQNKLAEDIFKASEPLDLLAGNKQIGRANRDDVPLLVAWTRVAHFFKPLEDILRVIEQLRISDDYGGYKDDPSEVAKNIRYTLQRTLIDAVIDTEDGNKLTELRSALQLFGDPNELLLNIDFAICRERHGKPEASEALDRILNWAKRDNLTYIDRTLIGEFIYREKRDNRQAEAWIEGVPQPDTYRSTTGLVKNLSPFVQRIRLNRLLATLDKPADPTIAVPDNGDERFLGIVFFERNLVIISNLWGRAWSGKTTLPTEVISELNSALRLFERKHEDTYRWTSWFEIRGLALDYFDLLIRATEAHGMEAVRELGKAFEERWKNEDSKRYWPSAWKTHIALKLYEISGDLSTFVDRLKALETEIGIWDDVHSRLANFASLAKAWVVAEEPQRADGLLLKMLEGSFNIYRDEDYQYSRWSTWLGKMAREDPSIVIEDIRRFCAALVILQDNDRGDNLEEAAVELITVASSSDPAYALEIGSWLLERNAIYYTSMIEGLLTGVLQSDDPSIEAVSTMTRWLIVPFVSSPPVKFAKDLAASYKIIANSERRNTLIEELALSIETKGYPSNRRTWWQSLIEGLLGVGLNANAIENRLSVSPKIDDGVTQPTVHLQTGEILVEEDARILARDYSGLLNLINKVKDENYFHWERIIRPLIDSLNLEQVLELQRLFGQLKPNTIVSSILATRLGQLGRVDEATEILVKLLDQSSPRGWDRWWDGGSRLEAIKGLIAVNPSKWRVEALELFVHDYLYEYPYPDSLLRNLEDVIPVLFDSPPIDDLWIEFKEHFYQLYDFKEARELPPRLFSQITSSHRDIIAEMLVSNVKIPVNEVLECTHHALFQLAMIGNEDDLVRKAIHRLLEDTGFAQFQGIAALNALQGPRSEFIKEFSPQISLLCASPNLAVREVAQRLAQQIGVERTLPSSNRKELPLIYRFHLPPREPFSPVESLRHGDPLHDTTDPLEMIWPFREIINLIREFSKKPIENILQRAVDLMKELLSENNWNNNAEKRLMYWLKEIDLQFTYYRPRYRVALLSLLYIVTELADAGRIKGHQLTTMIQVLKLQDSYLSVRSPVKRPDEIGITAFPQLTGPQHIDWIKNGEEAFPLVMESYKTEFITLGEISQFRDLGRLKPVERRLAVVTHPKGTPTEEVKYAWDIFPNSGLSYAQDYPEIDYELEWPSTVIYGLPHRLELGSIYWLAFNPGLAQQLGWYYDKEGLFRWIDSKKRVMVESIWWQDGPMNRGSLRFNDICGEGWLVVATKEAAKIISEAIGGAIKTAAIIREYYDEETNRRKDASAVRKNAFVISQ